MREWIGFKVVSRQSTSCAGLHRRSPYRVRRHNIFSIDRFLPLLVGFLIVAMNVCTSVAQDIPRYNVETSCRGAATSLEQRVGQDTALATQDRIKRCVKTEEDARERLKEAWSRFNSEDRTTCIGASSSGGASSYVELLVCLGMKEEVTKLRTKSGDTPTSSK